MPPVKPRKETQTTTIQSVARASRILLQVAGSDDGVTAKETSEEFGLTLPTAYHLLATLVEEGLLSKDGRRRYTLGPKAIVIADAMMRDTTAPDYYLRPLRELADATGETAYLSAWRRNEIQVLATVEGAHALRVVGIETGTAGYEHARASGKLLMAFARPEQREQILGSKRLQKRTEHTITTRAGLETEFETIRKDGYANDREEFAIGVTCISVPIVESGVVAAAYTISAPTDRFYKAEEALRSAALQAASRASERPD